MAKARFPRLDGDRPYYLELAERVERGEEITAGDRQLITFALRGFADTIKPSGLRFQPGAVAWRVASLMHHERMGKTKAVQKVADEYSVSDPLIWDVMKEHGEWAHAQFEGLPRRGHKKRTARKRTE